MAISVLHLAAVLGLGFASASPSASSEAPVEGPSSIQTQDTTDMPPPPPWGPVDVLGITVSPGARASTSLPTSTSYSGRRLSVPVLVARGTQPGRTLCLTAGIHGDELNGVEVVRRVMQRVDPLDLKGMLIGLPVVNLHGFRRGERDLPDRRDLNRHFPGSPRGSAASRIGFRVFKFLEGLCDEAIDFHTGSSRRTNFPQVRADVKQPEVLRLALRLQPPIIVHSEGSRGMLRRALTSVDIPTVTYESGEALRFQLDVIEGVVHSVVEAVRQNELLTLPPRPDVPPEVFLQSSWVRVDRGGILTNRVDLGETVRKGDVLGVVQLPFSDRFYEILAPNNGVIIGCAQPQLVLPGFAAFHLGYDPRDQVPSEETDDPALEHAEAEDLE
ncbi:MAG: succinylglutamate desuccinylase/aspartoacylase family protein [Myxococcota bacterium]